MGGGGRISTSNLYFGKCLKGENSPYIDIDQGLVSCSNLLLSYECKEIEMDAKSPKAEFLCTTHTARFQMAKLFVLEKKSIKCSFITSRSCMRAIFPNACATQSIHTALFLNEKYIKLASITYLIRCFLISTSYLADTIPFIPSTLPYQL